MRAHVLRVLSYGPASSGERRGTMWGLATVRLLVPRHASAPRHPGVGASVMRLSPALTGRGVRGGCAAPQGLSEELVDLRPMHPASARLGAAQRVEDRSLPQRGPRIRDRTALRAGAPTSGGAAIDSTLHPGTCSANRRKGGRLCDTPPDGAHEDFLVLRIGTTLPTVLRC